MTKIFNKKHQTTHTIDVVEKIDNKYYFFTEDSKCFPEEEIEYYSENKIIDFFLKKTKGENLSEFELNQLDSELSKIPFVKINYENHRIEITKLIKKKKYGVFSFLF